MTVARKVATNTVVLFLGKFSSSLLSLLVAVLLARHLGVEGYGKYSFVFSFVFFFQTITGLGVDSIVIRETTRIPSFRSRYVGNALFLKLALSLVSIVLCWITIVLAGYPREIQFLVFLGSLQLFFGFNTVFTALFQSDLKTAYYVLPEFLINIAFSALTFLVITLNGNIAHFVALYVLNALFMTIAYAFVSRKHYQTRFLWQYDKEIWKLLLKESWPIFLVSLMIAITLRIDQIMIFNMVDSRSLGLYSSAVKLVESLNIVVIVFITSAYPLLCSAFNSSEDMFTKIYSRSFKYMSTVIVPISVGTTLLSKKILLLIYGQDFVAASTALSILIWSGIFTFLGTVFYNTILAAGIQRYAILFCTVGAVTNLLLNLLLIPVYGISGAAAATTISYGLVGLPVQYIIRKTRHITVHYVSSIVKPLLCTIPMGLYTYTFRDSNAFFVIPVSALIYVFFVLLTKTFDREDIVYFKSIFLKENAERM